MMSPCATCRHWNPEHVGEPFADEYAYMNEFGQCARSGQVGALSVPEGSDNWELQLLTAAGFGCVEWEAKP